MLGCPCGTQTIFVTSNPGGTVLGSVAPLSPALRNREQALEIELFNVLLVEYEGLSKQHVVALYLEGSQAPALES